MNSSKPIVGSKNIGEINYNKRAEVLAKELLGKLVIYNNQKYMITVTEAYLFDEEISYINRYSHGKGHDALLGKDKIGICFVYADMLHIACRGGFSKKRRNEYCCDNVLIRGAIKIDNDYFMEEDRNLNYKIGRPWVLCKKKLKLFSNQKIDMKNNNEILQICDYKTYNDIERDSRINVNDTSAYRFYIRKSAISQDASMIREESN